MYRIFCESYDNFLKTFEEESYRLNIAKPFELIVHPEKLEKEKEMQSDLYKKTCDLLSYMKNNITRFPKFKAFLWTLNSRNIMPEEYKVASNDELEEQAKLVNSFLKLAYWY
ncbi:MAG: hypothetical protein J6J36_05250 [Clostridia bacterium]|nr:hypothetical protein [Clostridia bacterium]